MRLINLASFEYETVEAGVPALLRRVDGSRPPRRETPPNHANDVPEPPGRESLLLRLERVNQCAPNRASLIETGANTR
jgi:hypothetical protein